MVVDLRDWDAHDARDGVPDARDGVPDARDGVPDARDGVPDARDERIVDLRLRQLSYEESLAVIAHVPPRSLADFLELPDSLVSRSHAQVLAQGHERRDGGDADRHDDQPR